MSKHATSVSPWRSERRIAATLFLVAIVLYLPGIWWGLPHATSAERVYAWGSDELAPIGPLAEVSNSLARNQWFNPQYPLFHYIVQTAFVVPYYAFMWFTGGMSWPSGVYPCGFTDPVAGLAGVTLFARLASLLMGAGVVVMGFRTATTLWDRTTGIIAGVFVLLLYPMFYYSRTSNVDMAALFWTSFGLAIFAACFRDQLTAKRVVGLGIAAALAMATKDACYAVFLVIGVCVVLQHLRAQRLTQRSWGQACRLPLIGLATSLVIYAVASGLLIHPKRFASHLNFITAHNLALDTPHVVPPTWGGYLELASETMAFVADAMGSPMALCALAGLGLSLVRSPRDLTFALAGFAIIFGTVVPVRFVYFRFVFITVYILALFAARAIGALTSSPRPRWSALGPVLLVIVGGWAFVRGVDLTYQMINDSRYEMASWFQRNANPGDRIGYFGAPQKLPALDEGLVTVELASWTDPSVPAGREGQPEFVVIIPQQHFEQVHEWSLPDAIYQGLDDGSLGYQRVLQHQSFSLYAHRPVSFVNPPVQLFVRKDRLATISEDAGDPQR